ncbi:hotdog domain-containing protein [Desulfococcus sp.]|uniref:hotdog domain-containing protein n=1 Tax=Desulfococcus sp. TaxID=2025834 RepID=UPI0035937588
MDIITHQKISRRLCGTPVAVETGMSRVELSTTEEMAADDTGLVHGGFVFGLADYAAMIAVNHPNVVLGGADVKFLKPVRVGETITALATVTEEKGKKRLVRVTAAAGDVRVFEGDLACFVLDRHVLT